MRRRTFPLGWCRGAFAALCALALVLAAVAPMPTHAVIPDWLSAGLCHAPDGTQDHAPAGAPGHGHCALCQVAHSAAPPPAPTCIPLPRLARAEPLSPRIVPWPAPPSRRFYASRAPPRIG